MIWMFRPFSISKRLGDVYNAHCALVPNNNDWILIMDHDACTLVPETMKVVEAAIEKYPDTQIFGAMTNRVGYPHQCYNKKISENYDIKHHYQIAKDLAEQYKDGECFDTKTVAGFFLLFRKSFWVTYKFQSRIFEQGICFDHAFCRNARRVRVIKGAYILHGYRLNGNIHDLSHLN